MSRVMATLIALIAALFGATTPGPALAAAAPAAPTYSYTDHHDTAVVAHTTTERGPPTAYDRHTTYDGGDRWSHGASARLDTAPSPCAYNYDHSVTLAHVARVGSVPHGLVQEARPDDSSLAPGRVATNTGSRLAANQAAGNAARDAVAAAHPGALIEQSVTTTAGVRRIDILTQSRLAIESKVGRTSLTAATRSQIAEDSLLLSNRQVTGVEWVFSRSGVTGQIGPTGPLADALSKAGIP